MAEKCKATIRFSDDFGDNETTCHCQLGEGHIGKHREAGDMGYGKKHVPYILEWEGDMTESEEE